jgi:hypothetical protein
LLGNVTELPTDIDSLSTEVVTQGYKAQLLYLHGELNRGNYHQKDQAVRFKKVATGVDDKNKEYSVKELLTMSIEGHMILQREDFKKADLEEIQSDAVKEAERILELVESAPKDARMDDQCQEMAEYLTNKLGGSAHPVVWPTGRDPLMIRGVTTNWWQHVAAAYPHWTVGSTEVPIVDVWEVPIFYSNEQVWLVGLGLSNSRVTETTPMKGPTEPLDWQMEIE